MKDPVVVCRLLKMLEALRHIAALTRLRAFWRAPVEFLARRFSLMLASDLASHCIALEVAEAAQPGPH